MAFGAMPGLFPSKSLQTRRLWSELTSLLPCPLGIILGLIRLHTSKKIIHWAPTTTTDHLVMSHTNEIMRLMTPHAVFLPSIL
jgi:hypothetical protein